MTINIQHVLGAFQGGLSLNLRILREIYGVRFIEQMPRPDALLHCMRRDGAGPAPLRLNCDNAITPYTLLSGMWQPEEFAFVQRVTAAMPAFTLVDVGANVGLFSRQCRARLPNCRRGFAYEPDLANFDLLQFNLSPFPQTDCQAVALSDMDGDAPYFLDPENSGNYSLNPAAMPAEHGTGTIRCVDARREAFRWIVDGQPIFYKSDTQGFDEKIATRLPDEVWPWVAAGIFEVWQIRKPDYPVDGLRRILDLFPNKCFLTAPEALVSTDHVIAVMTGDQGEVRDLGFWR